MHGRFWSVAVIGSLTQAVVTFPHGGLSLFPAHGRGGACYITLRFLRVFGMPHTLLQFSASKGKQLACWSDVLWSANLGKIQMYVHT